MISRWFLTFFLLSWASPAAVPAPEYKVETVGACSLPELSDAIKATLQSGGLRVTAADGPHFEVWFRKIIPLKSGGTPKEYGSIAEGTLVGVIRYLKQSSDCRDQVIHPGVYTLRYEAIPMDGNHMGASLTPDFFLASPAAVDKDPTTVSHFDAVIALSRKGAGTNHPLGLYVPAPSTGGNPAFHSTDESHWVLEGKTRAQPAGGSEVDFPLAVTLIGASIG
jgi:hypothetical protein